MAICVCGEKFDVDKARAKYNKKFGGELDYDDYGLEVCASCAIEGTKEALLEGEEILEMSPWIRD
jgi:hypothetical protein